MFDVLGKIEELRTARKWSVYKLAQLSSIPQSTIATWYQKGLYPPIDKLEILCNTFQISLSEFFSTGNQMELNEKRLEMLNKWNLLTEKQKLAVDVIMDAFNEN
ncbi:helix-turn-helix transcriptional regulator [Lacrimispora sp.]|uniref:helix-turn-helix domain-containing protein n=1 Tax=Lacrimispora sp. TaxID=2719234 RepID=UPI0029E1B910|nr:hypothetical protein [Lacrimispora sp.]